MTTIGDIKKQALMLMFVNYENDLSEQDVDTITDEEYTRYLAMNVPISPCVLAVMFAVFLGNTPAF